MLLTGGVTYVALAGCLPGVQGLLDDMALCSFYAFVSQTLKPHWDSQRSFHLFSNFPFALPNGGLATLVGWLLIQSVCPDV